MLAGAQTYLGLVEQLELLIGQPIADSRYELHALCRFLIKHRIITPVGHIILDCDGQAGSCTIYDNFRIIIVCVNQVTSGHNLDAKRNAFTGVSSSPIFWAISKIEPTSSWEVAEIKIVSSDLLKR